MRAIAVEVHKVQGFAVGEVGRLARELQSAPGFDLAQFPEWRAAIAERLEELRNSGRES